MRKGKDFFGGAVYRFEVLWLKDYDRGGSNGSTGPYADGGYPCEYVLVEELLKKPGVFLFENTGEAGDGQDGENRGN